MRYMLLFVTFLAGFLQITFTFGDVLCSYDGILSSLQRNTIVSTSETVTTDSPTVTAYDTTTTTTTAYTSITIAAFFADLNDTSRYCTKVGQVVSDLQGGYVTCTSSDILTDKKKQLLKTKIIPEAIRLHAERLMVQSSGNTVLSQPTISSNYFCKQFAIPSSHFTDGYTADFLLYVSTAPTNGDTSPWALSCASSSSGRPIAGVMNLPPSFIANDTSTVRVVNHQLLHALGFSTSYLQIQHLSSLRGKVNTPVIATPNVVAQAQAFYACSNQSFMELEDEEDNTTTGSHWKRRSAKDELMCGRMGVSRYSNLTIAAMEDLGFYKGVYSYGEYMAWGNGVGCTLTSSKCITNSVSNIPSMFCTDNSKKSTNYRCPSDRLGLGACYSTTSCSSVPSIYQYFTGNTLCGEASSMTDYCPYVRGFTNTGCLNGNEALMPGSYITSTSRCFESMTDTYIVTNESYIVSALCAQVNCSTSSYSIRLSSSDDWLECNTSTSVNLANQSGILIGSITCPPYNEVCFDWSVDIPEAEEEVVVNKTDDAHYLSVPLIFLFLLFSLLFQ